MLTRVSLWGGLVFHPGEEICTLGAPSGEHNTSSCFGDSGGPLIADGSRGALLVGAVSYGGRRCGVKKPTVYTRIADNLGFIKKKADFP
ncbi:MAG: trypsin-like serine protease [Solirubrobacterales bacterium]